VSTDVSALAALHKAAFVNERPWRAEEFASLLASPHVFVAIIGGTTAPLAFALGRAVAGEAELLTLACAPQHQGHGYGRAALAAFEAEARARAATDAFLEVAEDNTAALRLYTRAGYAEAARRRAYYHRQGAPAADACLMRRQLTPQHRG